MKKKLSIIAVRTLSVVMVFAFSLPFGYFVNFTVHPAYLDLLSALSYGAAGVGILVTESAAERAIRRRGQVPA